MVLLMMIAFTYLPAFVTVYFQGMPGVWKSHHRLMLCWLIFMQALYPGRKTLQEMSRWTPGSVTAWRFSRLLKATYWNVHLLISWMAQDLIATLPPPTNRILYLIGDGSQADKRGAKNPVAQKGRKSKYHPWFFGLRFVLLIAAWDGYRIPGGFRIILPKRHQGYPNENALFREMVGEFIPPSWATLVIVSGDSAYGSKANMKMVKDRDQADDERLWGFVFAIARTWKTVDEKMLKNLVTHLPRKLYERTWIPNEIEGKGRKTFWIYGKRLCLCHVGDVTVVLSKKGRNLGPKNTKIWVTNLPELTPREVVSIYQKRWAIEIVNWELKSGLGLGQHQVSGDQKRSTNSVGIAVLAYLFLLRACHHGITPGHSWSIFQLQHAFQLRAMTNQVEHNVKVKMAKGRKAA
jgi:hypothetical protein